MLSFPLFAYNSFGITRDGKIHHIGLTHWHHKRDYPVMATPGTSPALSDLRPGTCACADERLCIKILCGVVATFSTKCHLQKGSPSSHIIVLRQQRPQMAWGAK